jgi:hypothetical protein
MLEPDGEPLLRQRARDAVRPLHEQRPLAADEVAEPRRVELVLVGDPVQVRVVHRDAAAVRRDDREARRRDLPGAHARARAGAAHELRLARAEIAHERDDVAGCEQLPQARAERVRRARGARRDLRRVPLDHRRHSAHTAPIAAPRSPATRPRWPTRRATRSPARPCTQAAARAAAGGGRPPASRAPHRPASTSPVPPVASPALPVGTIAGGP